MDASSSARPKVSHSNVGKEKDKLEKLIRVMMKKVTGEITNLASEGKLKNWDNLDPLIVKEKRKELIGLIAKATTGGVAKLETKIILLLCQIHYLHDENFRKMFEDTWL